VTVQARVVVVLVVLGGTFLLGYWFAGRVYGERIATANNARLTATLDIERLRRQLSGSVAREILAEMDAEAARSQIVTREVIRYVESPDAGRCALPEQWVQIHDNAAGLPGTVVTAGHADGASAGLAGNAPPLTDADALKVVTANYQTCHQQLVKARGWRAWYCGQAPEDPRCE
jgi:hypothetical protein